MIPVRLAPEPTGFDTTVRQAGQRWLEGQGVPLDGPVPSGFKLRPLWTEYNEALWQAYEGICAYLAIYFEWGTGAATTDHFVAKSRNAGEAYEWRNYRLSCLGPNRRKNRFDDVLDPIGLEPETFVIDFASGEIRPNPSLDEWKRRAAQATIRRLGLDSRLNNRMRARHYQEYVDKHMDLSIIERLSPFVHTEIVRQGLV